MNFTLHPSHFIKNFSAKNQLIDFKEPFLDCYKLLVYSTEIFQSMALNIVLHSAYVDSFKVPHVCCPTVSTSEAMKEMTSGHYCTKNLVDPAVDRICDYLKNDLLTDGTPSGNGNKKKAMNVYTPNSLNCVEPEVYTMKCVGDCQSFFDCFNSKTAKREKRLISVEEKNFSPYDLTPATTCHTLPRLDDTCSVQSSHYALERYSTLFLDSSTMYRDYGVYQFSSVDLSNDSCFEGDLNFSNKMLDETSLESSKTDPDSPTRWNFCVQDSSPSGVKKRSPHEQTIIEKQEKSMSFSVNHHACGTLQKETKPLPLHCHPPETLQEMLNVQEIPKTILCILDNDSSPKVSCSARCLLNFLHFDQKKKQGKKSLKKTTGPMPCVPLVYVTHRRSFLHFLYPSNKYRLTQEEIRAIADLSYLSQIPYNTENPHHEDLLFQYWCTAYDALKSIENFALISSLSQYNFSWITLGFQNNDPRTDFRGGGVLSLACMVYFAKHYTSIFLTILKEASSSHSYPFSAGFINVAHLLYVCFHLNPEAKQCATGRRTKLSQKAYKSFCKILCDPKQYAFEELFSCCCISVHYSWKKISHESNLLEFKQSLCDTQAKLVHLLESQPSNSFEFRRMIHPQVAERLLPRLPANV